MTEFVESNQYNDSIVLHDLVKVQKLKSLDHGHVAKESQMLQSMVMMSPYIAYHHQNIFNSIPKFVQKSINLSST